MGAAIVRTALNLSSLGIVARTEALSHERPIRMRGGNAWRRWICANSAVRSSPIARAVTSIR